jgi:acyl dehydratase
MLILESIAELRARVGQELAKSDWIVVSQERIQAFAEATGDRQWIHIDAERARTESQYGTTIAHGFLTLSLLSQMLQSAVQIRGVRMTINYGLNRVRFPSAIPSGSRVRATFSLVTFKDLRDSNEVTLSAVVESEHSAKPCCIAEWVLRYYV